MTLLEARIDVCKDTLTELQQSLSKLDPDMMDMYEKLVSILRSLSACNTRSKVCRRAAASLQIIILLTRVVSGEGSERARRPTPKDP